MSDWLQLAKDCFESSTSYLDTNWRKNLERNIALFRSKHPDGSKYNSPAFKHRSRLFRPKTKSVVRKNEAAAAAAFFANVDVVSIEPENDGDPAQLASAELMNELVNYRLTKTIPWFMTLIGALQEAQVIGIVASYQYWKYREKKTYQPLMDDAGQPMSDSKGNSLMEEGDPKVLEDEPCVELMPIENIRFDSGANWTDVVGTSPYFIRMVPMYVDDVRQMMKAEDHKTGRPKWNEYGDDEIRQAMVDYDTTRRKREGDRQDPLTDNNSGGNLKEFDLVWCHENFVRIGGEEKVYWTLGTHKLLSDPVDLAEAYFHGKRPIVIGCAVLEAHKAMPDSIVGIGSELQKEVNETVNQRRDNVSLVLNKRYKVKRNAQVDVEALMRNVPGGAIQMTDPEKDVIEMPTIDVTGSSYQEQDRLNVDFDELTGNFSQSSVSTSRNLNETVGGMKMLGNSANQMTEYLIRTFVETWVEPVLAQLVMLEQHYETDVVILGVAGEKAQLVQKYGINQVTDELLNQSLTARVNVGMGATDPQSKLGKFTFALKAYGETMQAIPDANPEMVQREIFALAGYKDGTRFFKPDAKTAQLREQMGQMQKMLQDLGQKFAASQLQLQNKAGELQVKQFEADTKRIAATKNETPADTSVEDVKAVADTHLTMAQTDLAQAQAAKALVEAAIAPSAAMAKQASDVER